MSEWQTLIGGCLALFGAWLTVKAVQNQIKQSESFRQDELRRRHIAARAMLPQALSEISDYCQSIAATLLDELERRGSEEWVDWVALLAPDGMPVPDALPPQQFPLSALKALQPFIETLSERQDVRHVAELIASLQILSARYNSFDLHDANVVDGLCGLFLDNAKLQMLAHAMFNYARFLDNAAFGLVDVVTANTAWNKIHGEATALARPRFIYDVIFKPLNDRVQRYKDANYSPWLEKPGE